VVAARRLDGGETRGVSVPAAPASGALDVFDPPSLRLPALDGIRGLAILMIMQYHFWGLGFGLVERAPRLGIDRWVARIREFGWTSVDLFFVLSGFLITGLLLDAKARSGHYFRNFYARRSLRIFPLYYLFLAFMLTVAGHIPFLATYAAIPELRAHQLWFWLYGVNVAASVPAIGAQIPIVYTHFWTLAVEEQFYLVWPLVVFTLDVRRLRATCIGMVAVALGLRIAVVAGLFGSTLFPNAAHVLTPARMDALALGALVALAARGEGELRRAARLAPYVAWGCAGLLGLLFAWRGGLPLFDPWSITLGFSVVGVLWTAVLVLVLTRPPTAVICRFFSHPLLTTFGKYSYCMYVVHLLVGFGIAVYAITRGLVRTVGGSQIPLNVVISVAATAVCLAIAFVSWHLLERPCLRLKVFFPYGEGAVPASPRTGNADAAHQHAPLASERWPW
jgi:peptidoglycan/LPS O-acetylase OafA/YrhL